MLLPKSSFVFHIFISRIHTLTSHLMLIHVHIVWTRQSISKKKMLPFLTKESHLNWLQLKTIYTFKIE